MNLNRKAGISYPVSNIQPQLQGSIQHPASILSSIKHQVSSIKYQASSIQYQVSNIHNMTDKQNEFYSSISKYYTEIFPFQPMQLQFVKNRVDKLSQQYLLDIGCATGELAFHLAQSAKQVTGIDLNEGLLSRAIGCSQYPAPFSDGQSADSLNRESDPVRRVTPSNLKFQIGNMLDLQTDFQPGQFDAVLCFGNTLVHLPTNEMVQQMLDGVFTVLKPGGHFLLQILNYDYILSEPVTALPVIETEDIRFIRKYRFPENSQVIHFQTELQIKTENKTIMNETPLLALQSFQLHNLLHYSGFSQIEFFSGFKEETFGGKHLSLVVSCRK